MPTEAIIHHPPICADCRSPLEDAEMVLCDDCNHAAIVKAWPGLYVSKTVGRRSHV